jgi:hypothetical protein
MSEGCNCSALLMSVSFSDCIVSKVGKHARTVLHVMQYTLPDDPCPMAMTSKRPLMSEITLNKGTVCALTTAIGPAHNASR